MDSIFDSSEYDLGVDHMVQENCDSCGASISNTDNKCPACGKAIASTLARVDGSKQASREYSSVFQQQGRMLTDADWRESPQIVKSRTKTTGVRCSSCGEISSVKSSQCPNCGASH